MASRLDEMANFAPHVLFYLSESIISERMKNVPLPKLLFRVSEKPLFGVEVLAIRYGFASVPQPTNQKPQYLQCFSIFAAPLPRRVCYPLRSTCKIQCFS